MGILFDELAAPFALKKLRAARSLLAEVTPLRSDCGKLCHGACCQADDTEDNGMLLLPFEERLYRKPIEGFPFRLVEDERIFPKGKRLICEGRCLREHRPLACRIFPLRLRVVADETGVGNHVTAEIDPRAWAVCPLPEAGGMRALSRDFITAVEAAGNLLCQNVYYLEALLNEQRMLDESRRL